jgi:Flp pilus assembly protein TadB
MNEEWIPIVMFAAIALIFFLVLYFKHRGSAEMQQTIRLALERGTELTPEIINRLGAPAEPSRNKDLRAGLIWMGLALGLALCGLAVATFSIEALYGCLAGAAFPFAIGLAYLVMWRYGASDAAR